MPSTTIHPWLALLLALLASSGVRADGLPISDEPENWVDITSTSALDATTLRRDNEGLVSGFVKDGIGARKVSSVPTSKKVFVDCSKKSWGYKKGALNPVNTDFEYQAKLLAVYCQGAARQGEMDRRPLHAVNASAAFEAKDYALALRKLRYDAEHGDAAAPYRLYSLYQKGDVIEKDVAEAGKWLRLAAERGSGGAQFWLGVNLLEAKEGFTQNRAEAFKWMTLAAEQRAVDSLFWLGHMYQQGYGTARDLDLAEKYFKLADAAGSSGAKERLDEVQKARDYQQKEQERLEAAKARKK